MSDEDGNYDDFMMSEDEDIESVEMEEDSDVELSGEANESDIGVQQNDKARDNDPLLQNIQRWYFLGKSYKEDQDYVKARETFFKVVNCGAEGVEHFMFKSLKQILKCWYLEITYGGFTSQRCHNFLTSLQDFLDSTNTLSFDHTYVRKSVISLLRKFVPDIDSTFLFDEKLIVSVDVIKFQLEILRLCEQSLLKRYNVCEFLHFKKVENLVWYGRLTSNTVDESTFKELEDTTNNSFEVLLLQLQCHIFNYLQSCIVSFDNLQKCVTCLEEKLSGSLSLSQQPRLMSVLHFGKSLVSLHKESYQGYYKKILSCREEFWGCLRNLEEIGNVKTSGNVYFKNLTLTGFILTSIILLKDTEEEEEDITPFELEQIKIIEHTDIVQDLKSVYSDFKALDLRQLASSMYKLHAFQMQLKPLVDKVYQLARVKKLWNNIAPLFTCISLHDIQEELKIGDDKRVSRDDLLTELMKSIMNGTAKVYFKLDLTLDLVYFGDEYKRSLVHCTKEDYVKDIALEKDLKRTRQRRSRRTLSTQGVANGLLQQQIQSQQQLLHHSSQHSSQQQDIATRAAKEWVDNVGVFHAPQRFKNVTAGQFVDGLRQARQCDHTQEEREQELVPQLRLNKYAELLSILKESVSSQDI